MFRPGTILVAVFIGIATVGVLAWNATRQELASGSGIHGDWKVVASWRGDYCIQRHEVDSEGGACGLAQPGTLNESISWSLTRGDQQRTIVAGPVPPEAERIEVTPEEGPMVQASLSRVLMMTFFVAEVPGVQSIDDIRAFDAGGRVIQVHDHTPLPPPQDEPPPLLEEAPPPPG